VWVNLRALEPLAGGSRYKRPASTPYKKNPTTLPPPIERQKNPKELIRRSRYKFQPGHKKRTERELTTTSHQSSPKAYNGPFTPTKMRYDNSISLVVKPKPSQTHPTRGREATHTTPGSFQKEVELLPRARPNQKNPAS